MDRKSIANPLTTWLMVMGLVLVYGSVKSKFLTLPLHNDEMNHMVGVSRIIENGFNPFVEWWSYHPPLVYELVAVIASFFQSWVWIPIARIIIALFGLLTLGVTYDLGKYLFNKEVGVLAVILLFFLPLFQAQTSLFHLATPLTFFFLAAYDCYLRNRWKWYLFLASCLVLAKETGSLIIFLLGLFDVATSLKKEQFRLVVRRFAMINLPLVLFFIWLLLNKYFLGWFLWPYNLSFFSSARPYQSTAYLGEFLTVAFWETGVGVLTLGLGIGLFITLLRPQAQKAIVTKELLFLSFLTLSFSLLFFISGIYLPRYLLFVFPIISIFLGALLQILLRKRPIWKGTILTVMAVVLLTHWFDSGEEKVTWAGERNYDYINIVANYQLVAGFVNRQYPQAEIIAPYPLDAVFSWSLFGYVSDEEEQAVSQLEAYSLDDYQGLVVVPDLFVRDKSWELVGSHEKAQLVKEVRTKGVATSIFAFDQ